MAETNPNARLETFYDGVLAIDHSRHRSPANALVHTIAGLVAYHFYDGKPSVFIKPVKF